MASYQNNLASKQSSAMGSDTSITPSQKTLIQSNSTLHMKNSLGMGLLATQNSPDARKPQANNMGGPMQQLSQPSSASALDLHATNVNPLSQSHSSAVTGLHKSTAMAASQVNLQPSLLSKAVQQSNSSVNLSASQGYQPSYLREPTHFNEQNQSQSPMKYGQQKFNQLSSSTNKSAIAKQGYNFGSNSKRAADTQKRMANETVKLHSRNDPSSAMKSVKARSGSQFLSAKKFNASHVTSISTTRAAHTLQKQKEADQEYSQLNQKRSQIQPQMENSFTRLHKGNSSVVRTFERKLLQQSSSQIRRQQANEQANALRAQPQKNRNSNMPTSATRISGQNHLLFNTRDKSATALSNLVTAQHYSSNISSSIVNPVEQHASANAALESDRTGDSVKCDTARTSNVSNTNGNRCKGQKQPRQSKSISGPHSLLQTSNQNSNSGQTETMHNSSITVEPSQPQNLTNFNDRQSNQQNLLSSSQVTPTAANPRMATSQSMSHVFISSQIGKDAHNRPNTGTNSMIGSSSLSFTRNLIAETAARNGSVSKENDGQRQGIKNGAQERDINSVSVSIKSNLNADPDHEKTKIATKAINDWIDKTETPIYLSRQDIINRMLPQALETIHAEKDEDIFEPGNEQKLNEFMNHCFSNSLTNGGEQTSMGKLQISTSSKPGMSYAQKFISPKVSNLSAQRQQQQQLFTSQSKLRHHKNIVSPMTAKAPTIGLQNKSNTSLVRGTSNSGNKVSHNFIKNPISNHAQQSNAALNQAFSPDKRPNISRSQLQNNVYLKRGNNKPSSNQLNSSEKSFTREKKHQRMFTGGAGSNYQNHAAGHYPNNNTPGTSISPSKGGPSYLQATFSNASKNKQKANVYSYQLSRVHAQKLGQNQSTHSSTSITQMPSGINASSSIIQTIPNTSSVKDLQSIKVLDQGQNNSQTLTQSHGPKISSSQPTSAGLSKGKATKKKSSLANNQLPYSYANSYNHMNNTKNSATRGGVHRTKPIANREKRPQSKRGMTVDKSAQNVQAHTTIRTYTKGQYINASGNTTSKASAGNNHVFPQTSNSALKQHQTVEQSISALQLQKRSVTAQNMASASTPDIDQNKALHQNEDNKLGGAHPHSISILGVSKQDSLTAKHSKSLVVGATPQKMTIDLSNTSVPAKTSSTVKKSQTGKKPQEHNYKRKQDQIIEMIQSNMKRSEDIQQSLFSTNQQKTSDHRSRSSISTQSAQQNQINDMNSQSSFRKQQEDDSSVLVDDKIQLVGSGAADTRTSLLFEQQQLQQSQHKKQIQDSTKPDVFLTQTLSPIGQETSLKVEDVFNDGQILHNHMVHDKASTKPREQLLPVIIQPEQHPAQASSEEEEPQINLAESSPFTENNNKQLVEGDDRSPMDIDELEVVTEDLLEDRHSLISSAKSLQKPLIKSHQTQLPMKRSAFLAAYDKVLTDIERKELSNLDLTNDMVYYASDILTRASSDSAVTNKDDEDGYYVIQAKDQILYRFEVIKVLGKGSFAQVVSAIDHLSGARVAVKINRNTEIDHKFAMQEGKLLKFLMDEDPKDEHNIVRMIEHIRFREHQCFVFELLNMDLFEHLKENEFMGFKEDQIRSYATQLLKALVFLEKRKVIHCDMKPENILCVDPARTQLKVVDFGSGCLTDEQVYTYVQSRYYRAPEVILRIPYSEKVDMWSLGCILSELYTGEPLFPGNNEQEQLEFIMELCGMFPEAMIDKSRKREHYFDTDYSPFLIEDPAHGILRIPEARQIQEAIPSENTLFLDFIAQCLTLDPEERPGAAEAMEHPWIISHFTQQLDPTNQNYAQAQGPDSSSNMSGYTPLRRPNATNTNTGGLQSINESLDLQNDMLNHMPDNTFGDMIPQTDEYFDGHVTESDRIMTTDGQNDFVAPSKFDLDQASSEKETVKFGHSNITHSRQREEAGARASAAEISPDRPLHLTDQQRMTSFIASQQSLQETPEEAMGMVMGRKTDAIALQKNGSFNLHPMSTHTSPDRKVNAFNKSPLKPSNESLLEHYKYEKQSKNSGTNSFVGGLPQTQLQELIQESEGFLSKQSSAKKQNNSVIEEPKIISLTSSFNQQQKQ